jgi:CheY-like chemotaxis protein
VIFLENIRQKGDEAMQLLERGMIHGEVSNPKADERSLVVVLAESNLPTRNAIVEELRLDSHLVVSCDGCEEVDRAVKLQTPDLLILGNLEEVSFLESYRKYSTQYQDLPIILLTKDPTTNQFFRDWAVSKGVCDVLSSCPNSLHLLRAKLQRMVYLSEPSLSMDLMALEDSDRIAQAQIVTEVPVPISTPLKSLQNPTYEEVLAALNQLTEFSKKYFGGMVLGNYWKKAHKVAVGEHPWLEHWLIEYNGVISYFSEDLPEEQLTEEQHQSLKLWVKGFLKECDRIIGEYTELLQQKDLSVQINRIISA